jgi:hypothetical protein
VKGRSDAVVAIAGAPRARSARPACSASTPPALGGLRDAAVLRHLVTAGLPKDGYGELTIALNQILPKGLLTATPELAVSSL